MADLAYFEMSLPNRAECIADSWLTHSNGKRGGHRWSQVYTSALRHLHEAIAQHEAEKANA